MIIQEKGHWRSILTEEEKNGMVTDQLSGLSPEEQEVFKEILSTIGEDDSVLNDLAKEQWEEVPVPIEQWINDPYYVGDLCESLYPKVKQTIIDLFSGNYHECIFGGAIGWGKTFCATICAMRILYEILCLKDPQKSLGLAPSEPIYIIPISAKLFLAKKVVFGGLLSKLQMAEFFRGKFEETMDEIRFKDKRVYVTGGAANDTSVLGLNVICAIIDESNFYGVRRGSSSGPADDDEDKAQAIYNALVRRVKSRFQHAGVSGMIFLISSKRGTEDFTERRIRESINDPGVFVRDYSSWDVREEKYKNSKWLRLLISPETNVIRVLEDHEETDERDLVIDFPEDYLPMVEQDPHGFVKDMAGIALDAAKPFIANRIAIDEMMDNDRRHPFEVYEWRTDRTLPINWQLMVGPNINGDSIPLCCPGAPRHAHLDMSKKHDATGFCFGHVAGMVEVLRVDPETKEKKVEEAPVIHIDAALRIIAPNKGEIDHQLVRSLVYSLIEGGMPIHSVSMDQWCFTPNAQLLKKKGIKVKELSTVRNLKPYMTMRAALYESRIDSPKYSHLRKELRDLEWVASGKKVDHPKHSSKDVADALTGVVFYLANESLGGPAVAPSKGQHDRNLPVGTNSQAQSSVMWSGGDPLWADEEDQNNQNNGPAACFIIT